MCTACATTASGRLCAACGERVGGGDFAFSRDRFSAGDLLTYSIECFKRQWQVLCLAALIMVGVSFTVGMLAGLVAPLVALLDGEAAPFVALGLQLLAQIAQSAVQLWLTLGMIALLLRVLEGAQPDLAIMFAQGDKLLAFLGQTLAVGLVLGSYVGLVLLGAVFGAGSGEAVSITIVLLGALLGAVPYVWLMLSWAFAAVHLVHDRKSGAIASLRASYGIARGKRWSMLGIGLLAALIYLTGLLLCCVGIVASTPLSGLLWCSLYLALSRDDDGAQTTGGSAATASAAPP
jgi:hypothetical protein